LFRLTNELIILSAAIMMSANQEGRFSMESHTGMLNVKLAERSDKK
jgi:hypothetical protein